MAEPVQALESKIVKRRSSRISLVVWLLVGPGLLAAGVIIGQSWATDPESRELVAPSLEPQRVVAMPSLAPIVDRVRGGVVTIHAKRRVPDDEGRRWFSGTGFVFHSAGLIITNYHLVASSVRLGVEVPGFGLRGASVVGTDPVTDIAVVRLAEPPEGLTVLQLGDSTQLAQGDWVVAVGNPFGYSQTVTVGVVSYVGRHLSEDALLVSNEYLQFSAPVNMGSSGGPVLDMQGHVVGVTTSTHSSGTNISFAVPSKVLEWVLAEMDRSDGRVRRGFLGLHLQPNDRGRGQGAASSGALVDHVEPGQPAARAGIRDLDLVVAYDGREVPDACTLFDWITYSRPGEVAQIEVVRDSVRLPPIEVEIGEVAYGCPQRDPDPPAPLPSR